MRGGCSKPFAAFSVAMIYLGLLDRRAFTEFAKALSIVIWGFVGSNLFRIDPSVGLLHQTLISGWKTLLGIIAYVCDVDSEGEIVKLRMLRCVARETLGIALWSLLFWSLHFKFSPLDIEVANGKKVETDRIIRGCKLELGDSLFTIDMIPFGHGSFDVIVVMDWLSRHKAEIVFMRRWLGYHYKMIRFLKEFPKDLSRISPQTTGRIRIVLVPIGEAVAKILRIE
ncbi:putative reverse transcriptase domain-containing protein [Tanacetum coccineum]